MPEEKRGPLYGLPVSIKECFYVKGYDHTNGLAKEIGKPSENDGSFVKVCLHLYSVQNILNLIIYEILTILILAYFIRF